MHHGRTFHLLLVEDNPGDVRLLKEALQEATLRYELHVTTDGDEALNFLSQRGKYKHAPRPSLILLDLNLPRKGGHEVLEELKRDAGLRSVPVIVLSSSSNSFDVGRAYELHANCYIQKPSDLQSFLHIMRIIQEFWMKVVELIPADGDRNDYPSLYVARQERVATQN